MKKVTLFNPQPEKLFYKKGEALPLALLSISAFLHQEGYTVQIYDQQGIEALLESVKDSICFGITSMTGYQILGGLAIARKVRDRYPEIPIVWGGWHPTLLPEQTIVNELVDIVVRGQGERTFTELVHALESKKDLSTIPGITYKRNGAVISNLDRPFEDINNFPPMPFSIIDMDHYIAPSRLGKRTINYTTSQGCPHHCGFCPEARVHKRAWKALSPERVIADIRALVTDYGVDAVIISDNEFFIDENRVRKICEGIIPLHIKLGRVNGRADRLAHYKTDTWELLKQAGLSSLLVGAESGVQACLDAMNKDATTKDTHDLALLIKKYGVRAQYSFFIGTPMKDKEMSIERELNETLDFIDELSRANPDSEFLISAYTPYFGTDLFEIAKQKGFQEPRNLDEWSRFGLNRQTTPWISEAYVRLFEQLSHYFFFTTGCLHRTIAQYPLLFRVPLYAVEMPFSLLMRLRIKYRFFKFPLEFNLIKLFRNHINKLQNLMTFTFSRPRHSNNTP
jgi:anaerobic magnesium-protoporphyrin IX monomethyl ester cyclase